MISISASVAVLPLWKRAAAIVIGLLVIAALCAAVDYAIVAYAPIRALFVALPLVDTVRYGFRAAWGVSAFLMCIGIAGATQATDLRRVVSGAVSRGLTATLPLLVVFAVLGGLVMPGMNAELQAIEQPATTAHAQQRARAEQVCKANGFRYTDIVYAVVDSGPVWMNQGANPKYPTARCADTAGVLHNFDFVEQYR